jgi:uncharacterized protein
MVKFVRSVMWKPVDQPGLEICELVELPNWCLRGTVLTSFDGLNAQVTYGVVCDSGSSQYSREGPWATQTASIKLAVNGEERELYLHRLHTHWEIHDPKLHRSVRKQIREDLADCIDVDLGVTPATNTLPIRRLNLSIGESKEVTAAWVRFPSLDVQPLVQTYTRLREFEYRYQSPNFETRVLVDDLGLVVEYEQGWTRVSSSNKS